MADKKMSWQEKCGHLSDADYHKALAVLNPKPYRKITQNKLTEKALLTLANIPTAKFIGFYHPSNGFDSEGRVLTNTTELEHLLSSYQDNKICIKLPEGSGGVGFFAGKIKIKKHENSGIIIQSLIKKNEKTLQQLLENYADLLANEGLLFESYVEQCPEYAKFNTSSVNTVRTWVLQTEQGINVIGAYFRIGRNGSLTDNGDGGGIMCPIDINTGTLDKGLLTSTPYREELTHHCDNHAQLEGIILSGWQDIISCSCETLRKLPYTRFAGLDVSMTRDGPVVIEINVQPDKDGAAYARIPSILLAQAACELKEINHG
tara:strand:+ start:5818 stop:6771 length:954 start_codon:yes stop_codon:yes gene_type:complete